MDKLDADVLIKQYADSVVEIGFARSVQSLGYESHAFVLGHLQADLMFILEDLNRYSTVYIAIGRPTASKQACS